MKHSYFYLTSLVESQIWFIFWVNWHRLIATHVELNSMATVNEWILFMMNFQIAEQYSWSKRLNSIFFMETTSSISGLYPKHNWDFDWLRNVLTRLWLETFWTLLTKLSFINQRFQTSI